MPRGDGTGPMGMGPMTGRAAGYCAGYGVPGYMNPTPGWGFGMGYGRPWCFWGRGLGRGGGRGWRHWYYATGLPGWMRYGWMPYGGLVPYQYQKPDPEMEKQVLKTQAENLQAELDAIKKRLSEIETETTTK